MKILTTSIVNTHLEMKNQSLWLDGLPKVAHLTCFGKLRWNLALSSFKAQVLTSRLSQIVSNTLVAIIRNLALHLPLNGEATQGLNK